MCHAVTGGMARRKHSREAARSDGGVAFLPDPESGPVLTDDELAENMGQEYLTSATSGEEATPDDGEALRVEELGEPLLETSTDEELAKDDDEDDEEEEVTQPAGRTSAHHRS